MPVSASSQATRARPSSAKGGRALRFAFDPVAARQPLLAWYLKVRRDLPWRVLWQRHADPFHIWVSEIMLQQTVIKAVIPVYDRFLRRFPDVQTLATSDEDEIRQAVRGLGYYRRFRMMHAAARALAARGGRWPTTFEAWKELPGIGDYTAAAISSIAFDFPAAVVDGNVERVFCRLLDLREAPNQPALKRIFKELANEFIDPNHPGDFNQALMELGQTVCTPSSPDCAHCPLAPGCLARQRSSQALAPGPKVKADVVKVAMRLVIVRDGERFGLWERPATARFLKGTWGFLTLLRPDARTDDSNHDAYVLDGGGVRLPAELLHTSPCDILTIKHGITSHRIAAAVRAVDRKALSALPSGMRWVQRDEVEESLVSNLDRKAWHGYLSRPANVRQM